jgi:exodeoxyribonuclease VII small subunit
MTNNSPEDIETMDFETAFNALQDNIASLEGEDLPLEASLALFERGQALAKRCSTLLEQAELKLRQLSPDTSDLLETET